MKNAIHSANAPKAIGPYSQAVIGNGFLFVSGQLPIHPQSGTMEPDVKLQTRQSLANVKAIVEEAGATIGQIVKTTVFLQNMDDFSQMNEVYAEFFGDHHPARACVEVSRLPKDALVEIEAIATLNPGP